MDKPSQITELDRWASGVIERHLMSLSEPYPRREDLVFPCLQLNPSSRCLDLLSCCSRVRSESLDFLKPAQRSEQRTWLVLRDVGHGSIILHPSHYGLVPSLHRAHIMPSTRRNVLVSRRRHDDEDEEEDNPLPGDSDNSSSNGSADIRDEADTESIQTYNPTASATSSPVLGKQPTIEESNIKPAPSDGIIARGAESDVPHATEDVHNKDGNNAVASAALQKDRMYRVSSNGQGRQSGVGARVYDQAQASRERKGQYPAPTGRCVCFFDHRDEDANDKSSGTRERLIHNKQW